MSAPTPRVPEEALRLARAGLADLKAAITLLLAANPQGMGNYPIAHALGLESQHRGKQVNYLTYSVLGLLMEERIVAKGADKNYRLTNAPACGPESRA